MSYWQPDRVTIAPSIASKSSCLRIATISLDFSATLVCPSTRQWRAAKAEGSGFLARASWHRWQSHQPTSRSAPRPRRRSSAGVFGRQASRICRRGDHPRGFHRKKTAGNRRGRSSFFWPNRAISTNVSAPARTASRHDGRISLSGIKYLLGLACAQIPEMIQKHYGFPGRPPFCWCLLRQIQRLVHLSPISFPRLPWTCRRTSLSRETISAILRPGHAYPPGSTPKHGNPSRHRRCRKDGAITLRHR
jgi:hypothetical protein